MMYWSHDNSSLIRWWLAAALVLFGAGKALGSEGKGKEKAAPAKEVKEAQEKETKEKESRDAKEKEAREAREAIPEPKPDEIRGVEIGDYRIRSDYPAEAQKCTVRFILYVSVRGDKLAKMDRLIKEHRQKIRDEVITATRLSPLGVFEEPDLKTFRRRILMRFRRTIPELVVEDLFVSDFGLSVKSL